MQAEGKTHTASRKKTTFASFFLISLCCCCPFLFTHFLPILFVVSLPTVQNVPSSNLIFLHSVNREEKESYSLLVICCSKQKESQNERTTQREGRDEFTRSHVLYYSVLFPSTFAPSASLSILLSSVLPSHLFLFDSLRIVFSLPSF